MSNKIAPRIKEKIPNVQRTVGTSGVNQVDGQRNLEWDDLVIVQHSAAGLLDLRLDLLLVRVDHVKADLSIVTPTNRMNPCVDAMGVPLALVLDVEPLKFSILPFRGLSELRI